MAYVLEIQQEALDDIADAAGWYEVQSSGLGEKFVEEVDVCFSLICKHPERYGYFKGNKRYRRIFVAHFPYTVVFELENRKVIVIWVTHVKQNRSLD